MSEAIFLSVSSPPPAGLRSASIQDSCERAFSTRAATWLYSLCPSWVLCTFTGVSPESSPSYLPVQKSPSVSWGTYPTPNSMFFRPLLSVFLVML